MFSDEDRAREWVLDIIEYADRIASYLEGRSFEQFEAETLLRDAVERCLLNISEAAVRLGEERFAAVAPDLPLHTLRGFGNVLRHEYKTVNARIVWDTATKDVPTLRDACVRAVGDAG
jgi:uncharacterized protein with HEPN domain